MRDPDRLLRSGGTAAELELLRAADAEEPPADGPERLRVALGLSAVAAASIASASTVSGVAQAATASSVASTHSVGTTVAAAAASKGTAAKLALTWLLIAGGGASLATTAIMTKRAEVAASVAAPREPRTRSPEAEGLAPAPPALVEPRAPAPSAPARRAVPPVRSIARETEQLEAARAELHAGASQRALSTLDRYEREHPRGVLREEAELLRIEALWRAGQRRRARQHAARFLQHNPRSAHAARIRSLIGSDDHAP